MNTPSLAVNERSGWVRPAPLEWLALVAGLVLTLEYAWLLDDAYVYFRYVDNWVWLDNGLVYNQGEFVEGFTSPFWALLLGALRLTGLDYFVWVRAVGLATFVAFWALMVVLNRRLAPADAPVVAAPLLTLSFHYAALCYFTSGTESPFVALAAALFALFALTPRSRPLQVAVAIAPLVRPELALAAAAGIVWAWWRLRRFPWTLALVVVATSGGWLLFRIFYYADLAPNTFHLKGGTDLIQGLRYLADTLLPWGAPLALLGAVGALLARGRWDALPGLAERGAMLGFAALVALYVVKVGGDARHFRYLVFPFVLVACAMSGVAEAALGRFIAESRRGLAAVALGLAFGLVAFVSHPRQLAAHPLRTPVAFEQLDGIVDAMHHRYHERLPTLDPWTFSSALSEVATRVAEAPDGTSDYTGVRSDLICWHFYEHVLDLRAIHSLGLTEPFLARLDPARLPYDRPAHRWSLIPLGRDLRRVQQRWGRAPTRGMLRADVASGRAPAWIADHLERLEIVERKAYNRHDLGENLRLALTRTGKIALPAADPLSSDADSSDPTHR